LHCVSNFRRQPAKAKHITFIRHLSFGDLLQEFINETFF
jgi:hypothetical protein